MRRELLALCRGCSDDGVPNDLDVIDGSALVVRCDDDSTSVAIVNDQIVAHYVILSSVSVAWVRARGAWVRGPIVGDTDSSICTIMTRDIVSDDGVARSDKFNSLVLSDTPRGRRAGSRADVARHTVPGHQAVLDSDTGRVLDKYSMLIGSSDRNAADQDFFGPRLYVDADVTASCINRSSN